MGGRRPPLVLLENVPGLLTSHKGCDFREVVAALNELGYAVDAVMMDAVRFVSQSRQRLFIIGAQRDLGLPGTVNEPGLQSPLRPKALAAAILRNSDLDWALRELPDPPEGLASLSEALEDLPPTAPEWWSEARRSYLLAQMSERHRAVADEMIRRPAWTYGTVFRRIRQGRSMAELRVNGVAGCLRTPKGGSGRQILFKAGFGDYHVRLLTPRECARLMGADDYVIRVAGNQALFGFGDAVCVPVVEWIAKHYLNPLVSELLRGKVLKCFEPERKATGLL
jgi:DNA (cytosine-5)-methyltransferase 1